MLLLENSIKRVAQLKEQTSDTKNHHLQMLELFTSNRIISCHQPENYNEMERKNIKGMKINMEQARLL